MQMEIMKVERDLRLYQVSPPLKFVRRDRSIPEHIQFLNEKWPKMGTEQIWIMLMIQRDDESIPFSAVVDEIGFREDWETITNVDGQPLAPDISEAGPPTEAELKRAKLRRNQIDKRGYTGINRLEEGIRASFRCGRYIATRKFDTIAEGCDWMDELEQKYAHPKCVVLINYRGNE